MIAAAGDIACSASSSNYNGGNGTADKCRQKYTSDLLVNAGLSAVLILGDMQYESASLSGINNSYNPTWGRVKSITRPAPGNHEYKTSGAAGYFDYFNGVGRRHRPCRRPLQGLLQLQRRDLAPDRAQLDATTARSSRAPPVRPRRCG